MWLDQLGFSGRRVLVTGGSSGMGRSATAAFVELGAEVHVFDINKPEDPTAGYQEVDLRDTESIDEAFKSVGAGIDVLINCAGMPQTFPALDVFMCNFAGLRHLTELSLAAMPEGGAVVSISSTAGNLWAGRRAVVEEAVATSSAQEARDWFLTQADLGDPYVFSKMAVNLYSLRRSVTLARWGIRMNVVAPGATATPMKANFVKIAGEEGWQRVQAIPGREGQPSEQANALVFLASTAASYINGAILPVDGGYTAGQLTE